LLVQPVGDVNLHVAGSYVEDNITKRINTGPESLDHVCVLFVNNFLTISVALGSTFTIIFLLLREWLLARSSLGWCRRSSRGWSFHRAHLSSEAFVNNLLLLLDRVLLLERFSSVEASHCISTSFGLAIVRCPFVAVSCESDVRDQTCQWVELMLGYCWLLALLLGETLDCRKAVISFASI